MIYFTSVNDISSDSKFQKYICSNNPVWGISELSSVRFDKIQKGDFILFYFSGKIKCIARVKHTSKDQDRSKKLFGSFEHALKGELFWSNLLDFDEIHQVNINYDYFRKICNYKERFCIRRIIPLNQFGNMFVRNNFESENDFVMKLKETEIIHL